MDLLLESGDALLLESGDFLLLELVEEPAEPPAPPVEESRPGGTYRYGPPDREFTALERDEEEEEEMLVLLAVLSS